MVLSNINKQTNYEQIVYDESWHSFYFNSICQIVGLSSQLMFVSEIMKTGRRRLMNEIQQQLHQW